jgi:hypothetical protein
MSSIMMMGKPIAAIVWIIQLDLADLELRETCLGDSESGGKADELDENKEGDPATADGTQRLGWRYRSRIPNKVEHLGGHAGHEDVIRAHVPLGRQLDSP